MSKFVKDTLRDKYDEARQAELAQLIDPATGKLSLKYSKIIDCPICNSKEYKNLFEKAGYIFVKCIRCGMVFSNPQVIEDKIIDSYKSCKSNDLWTDVLLSDAQFSFDRKRYIKLLDEIEEYIAHRGRLLDVGCSIGHFLACAKERGWDVRGLELNNRAIREAKKRFGLELIPKTLKKAGFPPNYFDVVTVLFLLEHSPRPIELLSEVYTVLNEKGILVIHVPNVESLAVRIMHEKTFTFDGRNHLLYFSVETLKKALEIVGYKILHYETAVSSLKPVLNYLNFEDPYLSDMSDKVLPSDLIRLIDEWIVKTKLGYYIYMYAIKE